ncbi:MAG: glycosyltransferase [Pseudomonadota bacterium]
MRIAMVIDPYDHPFNGTVVSTRRFIAALVAQGIAVRVLAIGSEDRGCPDAVERVDFPELRLPFVQPLIDRMRAPLARPVRARVRSALEGCDLIHVQYPFFLGAVAIGEARRLGIPVISSFHVQPENILRNLGLRGHWLVPLLYRLFRRGFFHRSDLVLAPSVYAAGLLKDEGVTTPMAVLSNGIPERFFALRHAAVTAGVHDQTTFRVLSVGRLATEKDQQTLIAAIAQSRFAARIELRLIGTGPRLETLERLAQEAQVRAIIGPASDAALEQALAGADLFVHCGRVELEGMSVLEAMAAGNAVLVAGSADSACPAIVSDPLQQFPVGDARALAERIDRWLADPRARAAQGAGNRVLAADYRHGGSVAQLLEHYRGLVAAAGGVAV